MHENGFSSAKYFSKYYGKTPITTWFAKIIKENLAKRVE